MTTFARIPAIPGPVMEIIVADALPAFHPAVAATFHAAPDGTLQGYSYDGTIFTAPAAVVIPPAVLARAALDDSDITVLRCAENGDTVPAAWATYRQALRAIVGGASSAMPTRPAYPAGT